MRVRREHTPHVRHDTVPFHTAVLGQNLGLIVPSEGIQRITRIIHVEND